MVCHRFVEINSSFVPVLCLSVPFTGKLVTHDFETLIITFYLLGDIIFMHFSGSIHHKVLWPQFHYHLLSISVSVLS